MESGKWGPGGLLPQGAQGPHSQDGSFLPLLSSPEQGPKKGQDGQRKEPQQPRRWPANFINKETGPERKGFDHNCFNVSIFSTMQSSS